MKERLILGASKTVVNPDDIFEFIETEKNNFQGNVLDFNSEFLQINPLDQLEKNLKELT